LFKRLQQSSKPDVCAAVRLCKQSLRRCMLPAPPGLSMSSFSPEQTSFILQVFDNRATRSV
jgi:hypothetical protein